MLETCREKVLFYTLDVICRKIEKQITSGAEECMIVQKSWADVVEKNLQQYKLKITFNRFDKKRGLLHIRVADNMLQGVLQSSERVLLKQLSGSCPGIRINKICFSIR